MDTDYTYEKPNEEDYFNTLLKWLKSKKEHELLSLLEDAKCSILTSNSFSKRRWNAMWTKIQFYVSIEKIEPSLQLIEKLLVYCDDLMPDVAGFDVMKVEFQPLITSTEINESPSDDLEKATANISKEIIHQLLPQYVKDMGIDMSRTYLHLYCIENVLRIFIDIVSKSKIGEDYFNKLNMKNEIRKSIKIRKQDEIKNKWIGVRGGSNIFYMDFIDLGSIIQNNWNFFSKYFPSQQWILAKIEELTKCRNLVAHNSIIGDNEKKMISVYFEQIMRQLGDTMRTK